MNNNYVSASEAINVVRFPLAVLVVFIHSDWDIPSHDYFVSLSWESITISDGFNIYKLIISKIFTKFVVPCFFFISGYLFFLRLEVWNKQVWMRKMKNRARTIVLPYFLWIVLFLIWSNISVIKTIVFEGESLWGLFRHFSKEGGWHCFWDSIILNEGYRNWLGVNVPHFTVPYLVPLWFLRELIVINLLTPFIYWLVKRLGLVYIIVIGLLYFTTLWPDIHGLSSQCVFFFSLGSYFSISRKDMMNLIIRYKHLLLTVCLLSFCTTTIFSIGKTHLLFIDDIYILTGVAYVLSIAYVMVKRFGILKYTEILVKPCFFIYAFHLFIQVYAYRFVNLFYSTHALYLLPITFLLFPIVTVAICMLTYYLLNYLSPTLAKTLSGGR